VKRVLYLVDQPLDERNYVRFGIASWLKRNWQVELWDLSPLARPLMWRQFHSTGHKLLEFPGYHAIKSKDELKRRFSALGQVDHFIDLTSDDRVTLPIKARLIRGGAVRVICATGSVPEPEAGRRRPLAAYVKKALRYGPAVLMRRLGDLIATRRLSRRSKPGIVVASGSKSAELLAAGNGSAILKAHNFDYDIYLQLRNANGAEETDYAVFIDQDYPFHAEFAFRGVQSWATPEKYYPAIQKLLRRISAELRLPVKVSAHPRSAYGQRGLDYFGEFRIEHGGTPDLIRRAKVVIGHDSTALQFAILFGKPLIFVTTDELDATFGGESIALYAAALGKSVINADTDLDVVDWKGQLKVDAAKYADYRSKYIKMNESPEAPLWQIVIDRIEGDARRRSAIQ
jgi:hypothetical protein